MRVEIRFSGDSKDKDMSIRLTATQLGERAIIDMLSRRKWQLSSSWNGYGAELGPRFDESKAAYLEFTPQETDQNA